MSHSYSAQVPRVAADYFVAVPSRWYEDHPVITAEFRDRWVTTGYRKRVSKSWLRKLRRDLGVSAVQLTANGRSADFTVAELLRDDPWPT